MYACVAVALFVAQAASEPPATERPASSEESLSVLERAATAVSGPRPEDAQQHIQWLLEEASEVPMTHELAGRYHLARGQYGDAERELSRALKLGVEGSERARVLALLGTAQLYNGRNPEAEVSLRKALLENPDERTTLLYPSGARVARGRAPPTAPGASRATGGVTPTHQLASWRSGRRPGRACCSMQPLQKSEGGLTMTPPGPRPGPGG
jgi:Flp pilus assembly protein TadD